MSPNEHDAFRGGLGVDAARDVVDIDESTRGVVRPDLRDGMTRIFSRSLRLGLGFATGHDQHLQTDASQRPNFKPPKLNVTVHNQDRLDPGYFFLAPHGFLAEFGLSTTYIPHQVGPHIYDQGGVSHYQNASTWYLPTDSVWKRNSSGPEPNCSLADLSWISRSRVSTVRPISAL